MKTSVRFFGTAIIASVIATSVVAQTSGDKNEPESFLFVQHADKATLADNTLTLTGSDRHIIIFSDRPHRASGIIPVAELVKHWSEGEDSFASDPPNAALVGQLDDGKPVSLIVELSEPVLSEGSISYQYSIIEGEDPGDIKNPYVVIDTSFLDVKLVNTIGATTQLLGMGGSQSDFEPDSD